jgi:hypothetical protein
VQGYSLLEDLCQLKRKQLSAIKKGQPAIPEGISWKGCANHRHGRCNVYWIAATAWTALAPAAAHLPSAAST